MCTKNIFNMVNFNTFCDIRLSFFKKLLNIYFDVFMKSRAWCFYFIHLKFIFSNINSRKAFHCLQNWKFYSIPKNLYLKVISMKTHFCALLLKILDTLLYSLLAWRVLLVFFVWIYIDIWNNKLLIPFLTYIIRLYFKLIRK